MSAEIAVLERALVEAKDKLARDQKSETVTKWRAALKDCYAKRDATNAVAAQVRAAAKKRDEVHAIAGRALDELKQFLESQVPEGEVDFRFPDEIEADIARGKKLRDAYELAARNSLTVNGIYGAARAEWFVAKDAFDRASFLEYQLRPQPRRRAS
jgi:hypothetical protein